MASTRLTILVDNVTSESGGSQEARASELVPEHGFSLWIEHEGQRVLLDTGQGHALEVNTPAIGVDLVQTDALVLSHGHYDHTGGLPYALERATHASLYCHPAIAQTRYAVHAGEARSIGIPERSERAIRDLPEDAVRWVLGPTMLAPSMGLTGPIPRLTEYEDTGGPFYLDPEGWRPDPLEDDQALWIDTGDGLVVCLGCAHAGVINTLEYIQRLNPGKSIRAIIGGLHMTAAGVRRLAKTAEALDTHKIPSVIACHCTGKEAAEALGEVLGKTLSSGAAGMVFEF